MKIFMKIIGDIYYKENINYFETLVRLANIYNRHFLIEQFTVPRKTLHTRLQSRNSERMKSIKKNIFEKSMLPTSQLEKILQKELQRPSRRQTGRLLRISRKQSKRPSQSLSRRSQHTINQS
jgi:predicted kinase